MVNKWVLPVFKDILIDASEEYLNSTDKSKDKTRTAMINRVAGDIRMAIEGTQDSLPDDLEKVTPLLHN